MKTLTFRNAKCDEIELRVGATNDSGFSLLLYKTARVDANILDETVGAFNWQKRFYQVKNTMICSIGINVNYDDETKEPLWIWKDDAGDESNTEAIKGEASDSFKRAGFAWNICRSLYSSPFIWIKKDQDNDPKKSHYEVREIEYLNNEISKLIIVNEKTKQVVFSMGGKPKVAQTSQKPTQNTNDKVEAKSNNGKSTVDELTKGLGDSFLDESTIAQATKEKVQSLVGKLPADRYAKFKTYIKDTFGVESVGELTEKQGQELLKALGGK